MEIRINRKAIDDGQAYLTKARIDNVTSESSRGSRLDVMIVITSQTQQQRHAQDCLISLQHDTKNAVRQFTGSTNNSLAGVITLDR